MFLPSQIKKGTKIMTEFEIIQSYRQARDKSAQIGILADLTMNSKREIEEILKKAGVMSSDDATKTNRNGRAKSTVWTDEMKVNLIKWDADGIPVSEISERLGVDRHAVSNKLWALKKSADSKTEKKKMPSAEELYIGQLENLLQEKTEECEILKARIAELELSHLDDGLDDNIKITRAKSLLSVLLDSGMSSSRDEDVVSVVVSLLSAKG